MKKLYCVFALAVLGIVLAPLVASEEAPAEYSVTLTFSEANGLAYIDALEGLDKAHALKEYSVGSISVDAGVVTLVGGVWPAWAAKGAISRDGGPSFAVATRDSDLQVTLEATPTIGEGDYLLSWTTPPLMFIKEGLIEQARHLINRRLQQVHNQAAPDPITDPVAE